jgi:hypothetical protein
MLHVARELVDQLQAPGVEPVRHVLQAAIQLEHATIPPYLYALYSLDQGRNATIAAIIRSVVVEEMLHLTLACNVLNALGGTPRLGSPDFIPSYPGHLPGTVQGQLEVGLQPFSLDLVRDVFMVIEAPDRPLDFPVERSAVEPEVTIGHFYRSLRKRILALGDDVFSRDPRHQIYPEQLESVVVVTDASSAARAIDTIVEQGEGTTTQPGEVVGLDYAHYYRFAEIVHGKRLIPNPAPDPSQPPDQQYVYGGASIVVDPAGVYPAPTNPSTDTYPAGTSARRLCETFNYTYTALLGQLHTSVNGQAERLQPALGLMMSLEQQAVDMMSGLNTGGGAVGPTFEYLPLL